MHQAIIIIVEVHTVELAMVVLDEFVLKTSKINTRKIYKIIGSNQKHFTSEINSSNPREAHFKKSLSTLNRKW